MASTGLPFGLFETAGKNKMIRPLGYFSPF